MYSSFLSALTSFLPKIIISLLVFSYSSNFPLSLPHFTAPTQNFFPLPSLCPPSCSSFSFYFPSSLTSILLPITNSFIPLSHSPSLSFPPIFSHPKPLPTSLFLFLISLSNFYLFNQSTLTPSYFSANPPVLPHPPSISFLPLSPSHSLPIHLFTLPPSYPIPIFPFLSPSLPSFTSFHSLPSPSPILSLSFFSYPYLIQCPT